jgi:outer membrane protein assembly factor BamB
MMNRKRYWLGLTIFSTALSYGSPGMLVGPLLAGCGGAMAVPNKPAPTGPAALLGGNVLIPDQFNNRILEITPDGKTVWSFGDGSSVAGATSIVGPNDAERVGELTYIAGTGAPMGSEPTCMTAACPDNRILIVDKAGAVVWQYGSPSDTTRLNAPTSVRLLPNSDLLVADQGNNRVIEIAQGTKSVVWSCCTVGDATTVAPNSVERLANGNTLIADQGNNRIIEVDRNGMLAWSYGSAKDTATLNQPTYASRLPNGDTLIADMANNRIVQVDAQKNVVWTFATNMRAGSNPNPMPQGAVRLATGVTLIGDQLNDQILAVDDHGAIKFTYGTLNMPGNGAGMLFGPYNGKVIGDFTGLTLPQ